MKFLILSVCVFALAVAELSAPEKKHLERVSAAAKKCQADPATKIDEEILKKAAKKEYVDKEALAKHIKCVVEKLGHLKDDDIDRPRLKADLLSAGFEEKYVDEVIEHCAVKKETSEKTAVHLWKCLEKHSTGDVSHH